jgi:O-antigen ligase
MIVPSATSPPLVSVPRMGAVHRMALAFVWLTFAVSAVVFTEPAPVDALMMGAIGLLPLLGLVRITPPLLLYLTIWLVAAASALIGTIQASDPTKALIHTAVTFFLTFASFVTAAFIMRRPYKHTHLIMHAYCFAAAIAAIAGVLGYFNAFPGAFELFTKFGRASGTFKDPNVFGPFLVPPLVYLLHRMLTRGVSTVIWAGLWVAILGFAILLSFSRGAWLNLAMSVALFAYLAFVTAATNYQRVKILAAGVMAVFAAFAVLIAALQFDGVGEMLSHRATLDQTYDQGPEGRFGGQEKAKRLIILSPFGIGAQQFAPQYHSEEPHNVYLAMFLNAGWLGGLIFAIMVALTVLYGLRHAFKRTSTQPLFIVAYACFVAHALEGFVIDLDHWRHFHVLMALVWGLMLGDRELPRGTFLPDAREVSRRVEMIMPSRPARILTVPAAPRVYVRQVTTQRREAGRGDSRPGRAVGRTFARQVP